MISRPVFPFFAFLLCALSPFASSGTSILWDRSRGLAGGGQVSTNPYNPANVSGQFGTLRSTLIDNGFSLGVTGTGFTAENLADAQIAVVSGYTAANSAYSQQDIDLLKGFVHSGGGLLIMAEPASMANYQDLTAAFGVSMGQLDGDYYEIYSSNFAAHPVFDDVESIYMLYAASLSVSGGAVPIAWTGDGECVIAASVIYGQGRVVILGDSSLWLNSMFGEIAKADNTQFAVNVFTHLADTTYIPEPTTLLLLAVGGALCRRRNRRSTSR